MKKMIVSIALTATIAGCSGGGPGKSDVEQALANHFEQGAGIRPTFEGLEVGACAKVQGGPGHACSVSGRAAFNMGGRTQRETLTGTFVFDQVGGRWTVVGAQ
ncbi:hypothetical protein E2F46_06345 [Luteimonas aestuarii]|uniref:Lipoprotein n=1 Tax=Luteimonas aestuarii TaxID=453837 RepID=A0A4R5TYA5_9GAMM|nr:hypothetical protein [Luteimonas aestuarii]TDK26214.1 hypothetical protein E2F46_06345 [Luteimonas aestuarii]